MVEIDAKTVMQLRKQTGAPMMDCKAALQETGGDMDKAADVLRKKGLRSADSKAGREAAEGLIFTYVHPPGRLGVMVEVACETDFVAKNEEFLAFGKDLCLHIAFHKPLGMTREDVPSAVVEKEQNLLIEQAREQMAGKPEEVLEKAVHGRMEKFFSEQCLFDQPWVKDDKQTVEEVRKSAVAKIGENIQIRRFVFFELGG